MEEANRRYTKLLAAKVTTDRYSDAETQVRAAAVAQARASAAAAGCQASSW